MAGQAVSSRGASISAPKRKRSIVLDTLSGLERRLAFVKGDTVASAALADDIRRQINKESARSSNCGLRNDMDDAGLEHQAAVQLWNTVLRLEREPQKATGGPLTPEYRRLLLHGRIFAFVVIHNSNWPSIADIHSADAHGNEASTRAQVLYLLDVSVRALRACIQKNDLELGRIVLDKNEIHRQYLSSAFSNSEDDNGRTQQKRFHKVANSCSALQMLQLWKENKKQDVEALFVECLARPFGPFSAAALYEFAEALLDIGKSLLSSKDFAAAIIWLERAQECLSKEDANSVVSRDSKEIHILVTHSLAIAYLNLQTIEGYQQAKKLVEKLRIDAHEDDRRLQLLQLDLFTSPLSQTFDGMGYSRILLQMIKTFDSSAIEFQLLHHHIQQLHNKSPGIGCHVLDEFMLSLRHKDNAMEWVQRLIITRIWLLVNQRESQEEVDAAQMVLSKLRMSVDADTAAAAQTLIWRRIEQGYQERQYATAIRWCRLALCHVFEASGRANRPLIERKLLLCFIKSGETEAARSFYTSISETTRDEPMTKYIVFKLSIKANDLPMAIECLRGISMSLGRKELLHACVLHARHAKAPRFMVQALKKLAQTIALNDESDQIHTPALFRCIILMLRDMIDSDKDDADSTAESFRDLCEIFDGVADAVEADCNRHATTETRQFTIDELEWLCRAAYSLGLKYSGRGDLRCITGILDACVKITKLFPDSQEIHVATDLPMKRLTCHFLISSALAALARRPSPLDETSMQEQVLKDYHSMREHIRAFRAEIKQMGKTGTNDTSSELRKRLSVLLIFDFEGAIRLSDWDELDDICEMVARCHDPDALRVLGDSLLRSQAQVPSKKFVSTMRLIVSKLREICHFSSEKLVKYYRCLFQAALYRDNDAAFQVLEEVGKWMQAELDPTVHWPDDELQFLVAVAFNEGVDWFAAGQENQARQWVMAATKLANHCNDGGKLKSLLCDRFESLGIGGLEVKQSVELNTQDETTASGNDERTVTE